MTDPMNPGNQDNQPGGIPELPKIMSSKRASEAARTSKGHEPQARADSPSGDDMNQTVEEVNIPAHVEEPTKDATSPAVEPGPVPESIPPAPAVEPEPAPRTDVPISENTPVTVEPESIAIPPVEPDSAPRTEVTIPENTLATVESEDNIAPPVEPESIAIPPVEPDPAPRTEVTIPENTPATVEPETKVVPEPEPAPLVETESPKNRPMIMAGYGESEKKEDVPAAAPPQTKQTSAKDQRVSDFTDALKGMISFFTIIRLPVKEKEMHAMDDNFWVAPVVGLLNGLVAFIVAGILGYCGTGLFIQVAAAMATVYVFSKFLHFDGLADFGDGMIVSSGKREDHVHALKDSLIGAGALGVSLITLIVTFAAYVDVSFSFGYACFVVALVEVLVKNAMVAAAAFGEPSDGMASRQVKATSMTTLMISTVLTTAFVMILWAIFWFGFDDYVFFVNVGDGVMGLIVFLSVPMSVFSGWLMAKIANKTFGFVNGDILGATNEISRAMILVVFAMLIGIAMM